MPYIQLEAGVRAADEKAWHNGELNNSLYVQIMAVKIHLQGKGKGRLLLNAVFDKVSHKSLL